MKTDPSPPEKPAAARFEQVAECLYRLVTSGTYYALVKRGGKQFRRSLKTKDRALANRRLSEFRQKVFRLTDTSGASNVTFGELAKRWLANLSVKLKPASARRRQSSVNNLAPTFGAVPVRNISTRLCEEWMLKRHEGICASTFNNDLETLRAVLALAKRDGLILENPAENIDRRKMEKQQVVIPTREQFQKLTLEMRKLDCRAQHGANLIELLAFSGMRLGEATSILWSDVDFEKGLFTVTGGETGTKNHEARTVPLFPAMRGLLERLRKELEAGAVEPLKPTAETGDRIIPIDTAKKSLATACKRAGLPDFGHHAMRHFFVSNAIEAGIDFKTIAGWVGHKDGGILVAKTYGHLRDTHSFEMAKRMSFGIRESE